MKIIIASLFLPDQPQFELEGDRQDGVGWVDPNLVKVNNPSTEHLRRTRNGSTNSNSTPYSGGNASQEFLGSAEPEQNPQSGQFNMEGPISSEKFMENLTANATAAHSPVTMGNHRAHSAEDFFTNPANEHKMTSGKPSMPETPESLQPVNSHDSTANLLKNVNKSLLQQSVLNNANNSSQMAMEGASKFPMGNSSSTVVTPKSRAMPSVNHAVVNFAKVKRQQQQATLPSVRRVPARASLGNNGSGSSNLKFSQLASEEAAEENAVSGSESEEGENEANSDSDLESDGEHEYFVPKFGGYSNNAKLRGSILQSSHELFSRLPWKIVPSDKGNGALKNAVFTAVRERTIKDPVRFVGTVGIPTDEIPKEVSAKIAKTLEDEYSSNAVIMDDVTFKGAYKNFCKQILWPTLHYQIPDNPNSKAFEDHSWGYYQKLNQLFADKIAEIYEEGDTVWVHDYHLMLVPNMVRKAIPNAKIGFFLHVSFPSSEVFRCLAQREKILKGLLGSNFIGFQTKEYSRHFLQTSNRLLMTDNNENELKYKGKIVSIKNIPVGIDFFELNSQLRNERVCQWRELIRGRWKNKKLIVCRDQFDRVRGLEKKMLAYERFLRDNPEYVEQVVLIQITMGTEKDSIAERNIMLVVDRINSLSPDVSVSQPVVFLHQDLDFAQYLALSCEADAFIVDPLRGGMNLTCHEFVSCSEDKNSPLLLSEFTGSANVLKGGALLVNPWDIKKVSQAIKKALEMPHYEKRQRWKKMVKSIINNDSDNWITTSLQEINNAWEFNSERSNVLKLSYSQIKSDYESSKKRIFILKISEPPTPKVLQILNDLASKDCVYVLNSFSKTTLENLYSRVPSIGLIAENGAYVKLNNVWYTIVDQTDWKDDVVRILDDKVERLPGSYYKISDSMIRFHTENAEDQDRVVGVVGDAITHINTTFDGRGIHAYIHKNIMFVQQRGLSLTAAQFVLKYHNTKSSASTPVAPADVGVTSSPTKIGQGGSYFSGAGSSPFHVDFACVTGSSSPVLEPIFDLIRQEVKKGSLRFGYAIVYGHVSSTFATGHVDGLNELLSILASISKKS
ncbi:TSL1 (YML100W) and TPS3 (YMR261C) [Zygosaccharomyces parabailii]|nr:TSL1 (YML100W) and TPS3 (YMR261C) [Zygosaccharomyces parabailii]CDH13665.1 related to Trehalose synthase complex regulatory subunit TPS3 [Zygosaccharomyces bailii ISA1307]